jgi:hypothetical protein
MDPHCSFNGQPRGNKQRWLQQLAIERNNEEGPQWTMGEELNKDAAGTILLEMTALDPFLTGGLTDTELTSLHT